MLTLSIILSFENKVGKEVYENLRKWWKFRKIGEINDFEKKTKKIAIIYVTNKTYHISF